MTVLPCYGGSVGAIDFQKHPVALDAGEGINYVVSLALSSVIQGDTVQFMAINDFLRHALKNPTNISDIVNMLIHV